MAQVYEMSELVNIVPNDGDIIEDDETGETYVWWNGKTHELIDIFDFYKILPRYVQISDENGFTPYHWSGKLDNGHIWFSTDIINRLDFKENDGIFSAQTDIKGQTYTFKFYNIFRIGLSRFKEMIKSNQMFYYIEDKDNVIYIERI